MDAGLKTYVSSLNEFAQKKSWTVSYDLVNTDGQEHLKTFTMQAVINGKIYPVGFGPNKKEAKQNAAKNALSALENDDSINTETNSTSSASLLSLTQPNFTCWLNEYSHKTRLQFRPVENTKMRTGSSIQMCSYTCQYVCDDKEFPEATGKNKKEAKEAAAKLVYETINGQEKEQVLDENASGEESLNQSFSNSRPSTPADPESTTSSENFIGLLNHYCQKFKLVYDFKSVEQKGPAHDLEFAYTVVINKKEFPEGRGKTTKEAKQKAAQLALSELSDSGLSSQILSPSSQSKSEDFLNSPSVPDPQPLHIKPRIQIAANFQNSPISNKKEQANINGQTKTHTVSNQPTSRFLVEFDSITRIGKGGFGRVFKARRKLEDTTFAVKIVKFTKKACREVKALSKLDHPNIVRYHTSWTENTEYRDETSESSSASSSESASEFLYIQMEFCEGETLREWIDKRNDHPEKYPERRREATEIIKQVLKAVKYVHLKKLYHRDLKPVNIMFGHDGGVKVGDFGLVTNEQRDDDGKLLERTKGAGTRSYMSPEQIQGRVYDRKVDIYAVGLIYFVLLWRFGTQSERQRLWHDIRSHGDDTATDHATHLHLLAAAHAIVPDLTLAAAELRIIPVAVIVSDLGLAAPIRGARHVTTGADIPALSAVLPPENVITRGRGDPALAHQATGEQGVLTLEDKLELLNIARVNAAKILGVEVVNLPASVRCIEEQAKKALKSEKRVRADPAPVKKPRQDESESDEDMGVSKTSPSRKPISFSIS
ncbi:interferon-induced, double-stranded RNA-activated protein kinase, partial [Clarias magur]